MVSTEIKAGPMVDISGNGTPDHPNCTHSPGTVDPVYSVARGFDPVECNEHGESTYSIDVTGVIDEATYQHAAAALLVASEVASDIRGYVAGWSGDGGGLNIRSEANVLHVEYPDRHPISINGDNKSLACDNGMYLNGAHAWKSDVLAHEYAHHLHRKLTYNMGDFNFAEGYAHYFMFDKELAVGHRSGRREFVLTGNTAESTNRRPANSDEFAAGMYFLDLADQTATPAEDYLDTSGQVCASDQAALGAAGIYHDLDIRNCSAGLRSGTLAEC
jgi:hypothetical protein